MKAKEEYVDVPRETRSKDITVYAIIFLVLLVGAGIFLAVKLLHKPADAALADSKSGIIYDSSAVEGGWDNLSPEEIAKKLPMSQVDRPAWDFGKLVDLGFRKIQVEVSGSPLPMSFCIVAQKG